MLTPRSFSLRWQEETGLNTTSFLKRLWCVLTCALRVRFWRGALVHFFVLFLFYNTVLYTQDKSTSATASSRLQMAEMALLAWVIVVKLYSG